MFDPHFSRFLTRRGHLMPRNGFQQPWQLYVSRPVWPPSAFGVTRQWYAIQVDPRRPLHPAVVSLLMGRPRRR